MDLRSEQGSAESEGLWYLFLLILGALFGGVFLAWTIETWAVFFGRSVDVEVGFWVWLVGLIWSTTVFKAALITWLLTGVVL